jgi:osmotically inducible lipoprotein OsmB
MNSAKKIMARKIMAGLLLASFLSGCAGMSQRQKNAATGAAIGGVAGAVLTGGSSLGTVGGATIGGVIGHGVDSLQK